MAIGETADLIIALNLRGNAERGLRGISSAIDNLSRNATVRGGLGQITTGLGIGLRNATLIGGAGVAVLTTQIRAGVESLRELENVEAQTRAALESTGGVSGQTAESIRQLSEEYETLGGVIDDKVIQSGINVLLTFRRIDQRAFQPAIEAALDLSTALGTDLQTAVLQVGKALEDPVSGVTALRRAGVQLTDAQEAQIKALVESNRLYEAQTMILDELAVQVGGRFAAAGRTNEATVARMGDAWEDLQQTLSRATLPAIDRVSRRLTEIFSDPAVITAVEDFGERIAGFLNEDNLRTAEGAIRDTFGYLASIPWGTIGEGLRIAGQGAKVAIDAFRSLPPGVQNALITLLAANKLTGGLVATGLGQLASVALGQLKTIMAGSVTVIGKTVVGPGGGGPAVPSGPAGGGFFGQLLAGLRTGAALASPLLVAAAAVEVVNFENMRNEQRQGLQGILDELPRTPRRIDDAIEAIQAQINMERPLLEGVLFNTNIRPQLERELAELQALKRAQQQQEHVVRESGQRAENAIRSADLQAAQRSAVQTSRLAAIEGVSRASIEVQRGILAKRTVFSPTIQALITNNLSVNEWQRTVYSSVRATTATTPTGPTII